MAATIDPRSTLQRVYAVLRNRHIAHDTHGMTATAIAQAIDSTRLLVMRHLQALTLAGFADRRIDPADRRNRQFWFLTRDNGIEAPAITMDGQPAHDDLMREAIWRTVRMLRHSASAREIAAHASTAERPVADSSVMTLLTWWSAAGYTECVRPATQPGSAARNAPLWRVRPGVTLGPRPPVVLTTTVVADADTGEVRYAAPPNWRGARSGHADYVGSAAHV